MGPPSSCRCTGYWTRRNRMSAFRATRLVEEEEPTHCSECGAELGSDGTCPNPDCPYYGKVPPK